MSTAAAPRGLAPELRQLLLGLARESLAARLRGAGRPRSTSDDPALDEPRGAFVTLRRRSDGDLRGCVGIVEPRLPLREAVPDAAEAAAFRDRRFSPVQAHELDALSVQVSVLGPLQPAAPEEVEVGVHGLVVRRGAQAGLLLPQVAVEQGWDREAFLSHTCRKAGLDIASWRSASCSVYVFTAECFGEDDATSR
ncbi:MAG TPA: AmmeMemoRadiSam system protein A [Vicinamibacteria bacterium]|nr:AmmeMemoRadiSam system protein A [Vicinamibacteria bacterium]